jgi:hypothetical protein
MYMASVVLLFVSVITIILFFERKCRSHHDRNQRDSDSDSNVDIDSDIEANREAEREVALNAGPMNIGELMALYSEAFERNKNQIALEVEVSCVSYDEPKKNKDITSDTSDEEDHPDDYEDDDPSVYLAIEGARSIRRSERHGNLIHVKESMSSSANEEEEEDGGVIASATNNIQSSGRNNSIRLIHPRSQTKAEHKHKTVVGGTCVICLEEMKAGETVVWSETSSCRHVYHKECMVSFLAHKAKRQKQRDLGANPCPTCRQPFVTVYIPTTSG